MKNAWRNPVRYEKWQSERWYLRSFETLHVSKVEWWMTMSFWTHDKCMHVHILIGTCGRPGDAGLQTECHNRDMCEVKAEAAFSTWRCIVQFPFWSISVTHTNNEIRKDFPRFIATNIIQSQTHVCILRRVGLCRECVVY